MKRALRFVIYLVIAFTALLLSGFGNTINVREHDLALSVFIRAVLVLFAVIAVMYETHLSNKRKIDELSSRVEKLEKELDKLQNFDN